MDFKINSNISKYFDYFFSLTDKYSIKFLLDFNYSKIKLIGTSPEKSRMICLEGNFNILNIKDELLNQKISFVCKVDSEQISSDNIIIECFENQIKINSIIAPIYEGELYSDWDGCGEEAFNFKFKVKDEIINKLINASTQIEDAELKIKVNPNFIQYILSENNVVNKITNDYYGNYKNNIEVINEFFLIDLKEIYDNKLKYFKKSAYFYTDKETPLCVKFQNNDIKILHILI